MKDFEPVSDYMEAQGCTTVPPEMVKRVVLDCMNWRAAHARRRKIISQMAGDPSLYSDEASGNDNPMQDGHLILRLTQWREKRKSDRSLSRQYAERRLILESHMCSARALIADLSTALIADDPSAEKHRDSLHKSWLDADEKLHQARQAGNATGLPEASAAEETARYHLFAFDHDTVTRKAASGRMHPKLRDVLNGVALDIKELDINMLAKAKPPRRKRNFKPASLPSSLGW